MRVVLEVFARLSSLPVNHFSSHWLNREQLNILCKAWEGILLMLVQEGKDHQYLNEVSDCLYTLCAGLLSSAFTTIISAL